VCPAAKTQTWASTHQTHSPGQTSTGQRDEHNTKCCFHRTRPETHQNLIHPDKEQNRRHQRRMTAITAGEGALLGEHRRHDLMTFPRVTVCWSQWVRSNGEVRSNGGGLGPITVVRRDRTSQRPSGGFRPHVRFATVFAFGEAFGYPPGDNSLTFASRPSSLTRTGNYGDNRIRTGDPLLAKQVLYQLSYVPLEPVLTKGSLVGQGGLEPPTPRLSSVCSNQLSY
jgi:hypothetical protein